MLNKYLFRPVIGVLESDIYHLLPTLRFTSVNRKLEDDKKKLKTFAIMLTWINFCIGFSWTNRLKVMEVDEDQIKFQKYSLKQKWLLGYTLMFTVFGIVIGFTAKIPHSEVLSMFFYCWALVMLITHSNNRADFIIDEMYNDTRGMNEALLEYLMENLNERVITAGKIQDLEAQLKEAKKKPVRKSAPKKTVSAE